MNGQAAPSLGLAVSGGPDSLALLLIASACEPVRAATVDHGLRPEARAEAEYVAAICAERAIPHDILTVSLSADAGQADARAARYKVLTDWCRRHRLSRLATAHHIDDQAETVLMRLARGAGLAGLAGVRARRALSDDVVLERPLLGRRKSELEQIVAAAGLAPVRDPSNLDRRYDRTAARALLASAPWLDAARLAHSAACLSEAEAALQWSAARVFAERVSGDGSFDPGDLPPELVRRVVCRIFAEAGEHPRGPEIARLIDALNDGRPATLGRIKAEPGPRWVFKPAPPRKSA